METLVLYWDKGPVRIYTRRMDLAQQAAHLGYTVTILSRQHTVFA